MNGHYQGASVPAASTGEPALSATADCRCSHGFSCHVCEGCRDHHEPDCPLDNKPATAATDYEMCPECETGVVVHAGPQCGETGHVPYACSEHCGWSS